MVFGDQPARQGTKFTGSQQKNIGIATSAVRIQPIQLNLMTSNVSDYFQLPQADPTIVGDDDMIVQTYVQFPAQSFE